MKLGPKPDSQSTPLNRRGTKTFRAYAAYSMGIGSRDGACRGDRLLMNASARRVARAAKLARQAFEHPVTRPLREPARGTQLYRMTSALIGSAMDHCMAGY